jgi:site-specific DNA-methyltransferase (adenine-specific)
VEQVLGVEEDDKGVYRYVAMRDVWDIKALFRNDQERLGYPTQKPEALLERIIQASSDKGNIVLDPFFGCGTTIITANKLKRKWIGIDVTYLAINLIEKRLIDNFGDEIKNTYKIYGDPFDFASAQALFDRDSKDKHAFELWALKLVNARPRAKDGGVDGIIGFIDENDEPKRIIVQVKGEHHYLQALFVIYMVQCKAKVQS